MNKNLMGLIKTFILTAILQLGISGSTQAALIDRGSGLIYDDVLDVTWLQDTAYIVTSGYAPWNGLNWYDARTFTDTLEYYDSERDVIWDDWRLPTTIDDISSAGFDTSGTSSELAYMYYINLGFGANTTFDVSAPSPSSSNYNPFINLSYRGFWSDTQALDEWGDAAGSWYLHYHFGFQGVNDPSDAGNRVWAVRDGDVLSAMSVPEPSIFFLFGTGLFGLIYIRCRKLFIKTST